MTTERELNANLDAVGDAIKGMRRMDPNATLRAMREAYATEDYETAAELADKLDQHISAGGFLPTAWNASHPPF